MKLQHLPRPEEALPGRTHGPRLAPPPHAVLGTGLVPPFPAGTAEAHLGMGCFWGAERLFWGLPGVHTTAVGYAGGLTPNPTYAEICTGLTGHAEVVRVVYVPETMPFSRLVATFFSHHDPTQGMRQGNDIGTQYRSVLFVPAPQQAEAEAIRDRYGATLLAHGLPTVGTEIGPLPPFYYAEDYHQQYLARNPDGYCGLRGTGIPCLL